MVQMSETKPNTAEQASQIKSTKRLQSTTAIGPSLAFSVEAKSSIHVHVPTKALLLFFTPRDDGGEEISHYSVLARPLPCSSLPSSLNCTYFPSVWHSATAEVISAAVQGAGELALRRECGVVDDKDSSLLKLLTFMPNLKPICLKGSLFFSRPYMCLCACQSHQHICLTILTLVSNIHVSPSSL